MKAIKLVIIGALVALLGSSAQAASSYTLTMPTGSTASIALKSDNNSDRTIGSVTYSYTDGSTGCIDETATSANFVNKTMPKSSGTATAFTVVSGQKAGTVTIQIRRNNASQTILCNLTVTVTAPTEKTIMLDGGVETIDTGVELGGRYYYRLVGDGNATDYVTLNPASAIRPGSGQTATGDLKLTGKKETTSPVTVRLQTNGSTSSSGTYRDLKVYLVTVKKPIAEIDCGDVFISHGETQILTNDQNEAILWSKVNEGSSSSSNDGIAKLVSSNDNSVAYAAVNNPVRDGTAKLVVAVEGTNYNFTVHAMTVEIEKTVKAASENPETAGDRSNATIRVTTHILYNVHEIPTNTILFIGSTCASHGLGGSNKDVTTARNNTLGQINTIATKGRVKWYLYGNQSGQQATTTAKHSGTLDMEKELTSADVPTTNYGTGRHRNLLAYLTCLDNELKDDHSGVDYIVLSFDGGRLAKQYRELTTDYSALEARVAKKLEWYYVKRRVIWIREAYPVTWDADPNEQYGNEYYRPANTMDDEVMNQKQWEAMVAMLDPVTYNSKPSGSRYTETKTGTGSTTSQAYGKTIYAATRNDIQTDYNSSDNVKAFLDENIKKATYDTKLVDNVLNLNNSLRIVPTGDDATKKEVHFYTWKGEKAPETYLDKDHPTIADLDKGDKMWAEEPDSAFEVDHVNYQVTANVSNITQETWNMFEISVVDNGTFLQESIKAGLAEYDEKTGKYKVNPNDGPAHVTLYSMEGGKKYEVQSTAKATSVLWPMDLIPLTIPVKDDSVTYGDAVPTERFGFKDVSEWTCPEAVDVTKIEGLDTVTFGTTYAKGSPVGSDYSINTNSTGLSSTYYAITVVPGTLTVTPATIKPVKPGENPPEDGSPYTAAPCIERMYDGNGTNITAEVFNVDDTTDVPTYRYSLTENGPFKEWSEVLIVNVTNENGVVMSNKVWYTVTTKTAGNDVNYFAATNFAWVLINPRPVAVTAADSYKPYDGMPLTDSGFTTYPSPATAEAGFVGTEGIESVTMTEDSKITDVGMTNNVIATITPKSNTLLENYLVTTNSGTLEVWQSDMTADDADAWKTYDGIATNITVTPKVSGCDIYYAPEPNNKKDETRDQPKKLFAAARRVDPDDVPKYLVWGDKNVNVTYMDACVSNKVWYKVVDPTGNHSNVYGYAFVTIEPREVEFRFPKAEKPYDGNGDYEDLVTNLVGTADNMVGDEMFDCSGSGVFTNVNVGAGESYFVLKSVKLDAGVNTFFRNYTIKYWADGDYNELAIGSDKDHATSVTVNTTALPNGTDGEITIIPMTIGGVTQPGTAGQQIPVDPTDPTTWTNGAKSVVKEYDAKKTNIVVTVTDPAAATVYYCYDDGTGKPAGGWTYANFDGYTDVTNAAPVWYKVEYPNYLPVTNRAFVTITPAQIQGKETEDAPWAQAENVEIWIEELPAGGSTNIIVKSELFGFDKATYRYSVKDPATGAEWIDAASFKGFSLPTLATNVWCEVSGGSNYLPTNLVAHVAIWQREADVEGGNNVGNAEEIQEELEKNAEKYKTSEHEYVKLRVTVTKADEVPADDAVGRKIRTTKTEADKQVDAIVAAASAKAKVAKEEIVSALVDLVLERTYDKTAGDALDHGSYVQSDWDDIGANGDNTDLYKFEFDYNKPAGYDLVGVCKYHNGAKWLSEGSNKADRYKISTKSGKQILTVWLKEFCMVGPCFKEHVVPPAPSGCEVIVKAEDSAWVYEWKFTGKTTEGVLKTIDGVAAGCRVGAIADQIEAIRVPSSLKIQGYTVKCNPTCLDVEEAAFVGSSRSEGEAFWITKPTKGAFYDAGDGVAGVSFSFGNVIGRSSGKYELVGRFRGSESFANETYDLQFAGQGSYDASKLRVTSASGSFAGTMVVPRYPSYVRELAGCPEATVWDCMGVRFLGIGGRERTAAFGKWKMKYCATASKNFAAGKGRPATKNGAKWGY